jgi:translation elongation factor EF-Tu-like GTPase
VRSYDQIDNAPEEGAGITINTAHVGTRRARHYARGRLSGHADYIRT